MPKKQESSSGSQMYILPDGEITDAATIERYDRICSELESAKKDIAALLWLGGMCQYCKFGKKDEYSGANRWTCKLGSAINCRPEWRGAH